MSFTTTVGPRQNRARASAGRSWACLVVLLCVATAVAQDGSITARYDSAARFADWNAGNLLSNANVRPQWSRDGAALWYGLHALDGREFVVRRARDGAVLTRIKASTLLPALQQQTGMTPQWTAFVASSPEISGDGRRLLVTTGETRFGCDLPRVSCTRLVGPRPPAPGDTVSPDGTQAAFVRDHNLWIRDLSTGTEHQITRDGERYRSYGTPTERAAGAVLGVTVPTGIQAAVVWAPDSRHLVTVRVDETALPEFALVEEVPRDQLLPRVHTFRYGFAVQPGDAREDLFVVDALQRTITRVDIPTEPIGFDSTVFMRRVWWSTDGRRLAIAIAPLNERWVDLYGINVESGAARRIFREESTSLRRVLLSGELAHPPSVALLSNGDVVWYSTRDGFGHLYLLDGATGRVKNPITSGSWAVHRLLRVDERRGWIYFAAGGDTYGPEPYFASIWRVRPDGTALARLTPEIADHAVGSEFIGPGAPPSPHTQGFAPDSRHFVDSYSTPLSPEVTVLRSADGRLIAELARASLAPVVSQRYHPPERIVAAAPEGRESLHGTLLFPSDFDPSKRYPVIDAIYNGSQVVKHARRFADVVFGEAQSLAELGFIVLVMDARGTPLRSQAFLDFSAEHTDQVAMIGDHVHVLKSLGRSRPYMDLTRVGITGFSNGGYAALRGMLAFPDFFTVGVSTNGSHDLRKYMIAAAGGAHDPGMNAIEKLRPRANQEFVANLRGKLLLILGGFDTNVPVAASYGVIQALIDAGKNFDMIVVPRMGHRPSIDSFAVRKQWDYFVQHLLGVSPPDEYRMPEIRSPEAP